MDAGDLLEELIQSGVNIVLSGHKHVPYVWRLGGPLRRERRHGRVAPAPRVHQALLQRPGVRERRGEDHAQVPVRRGQRDRPLPAARPGSSTIASSSRRCSSAASPRLTRGVLAPNRTIPKEPIRMKVVVLVDGEHYPSVTRWAIDELRGRGLQIRSPALFVGGGEKLDRVGACSISGSRREVRCPDRSGGVRRSAPRSTELAPDAIFDLSDEPVPRLPRADGGRGRARWPEGSPTSARLPASTRRSTRDPLPSRRSRCIGIGKRTGQDRRRGRDRAGGRGARRSIRSSSRWAARVLPNPRSPRPARSTLDALLELARRGRHAASDYLEIAATSGVRTVGARRAGGGLAGAPRRRTSARPPRSRSGSAPGP